MKNRCSLNLFLLLGLLLALGTVLLCAPAATDARELEPPALAPPTPQRDLHHSSPQDGLAPTRWISSDGREPITFAQWWAQRPPPSPLHVQRVYASPASAASGPVVCALVNPGIYDGIATSLARWTADVESEGWSVLVYAASFPNASALRDHLATIPDLDGCLLIGDLPVPWYETSADFPLDVYYMDLDGTWTDSDLNGLYDEHTGDTAPEIWIGRLTAHNLDFGDDEASLLDNYFVKNHAYRTGSLSLPSRALVYLDDGWAHSADNMRDVLAQLYPDTTAISDPETTRALDYSQRLVDYYAWVNLFAHSTPFQHYFTYQDGDGRESIYNEDIYRVDPHAFFYNLFSCSVGRFVERNYLAGWYVFADTYGLLAIGPTKTGGMKTGNALFYERLAQGASLGQAFLDWFEVYGVADPPFHYPLTLHGDPTLTVITTTHSGIAPASVAITGPMTGDVGITSSFTATVEPASVTQPLMFEWQATGHVPVAHKSGRQDTVAFTWWNTPGPKTITVTATNFEGAVSATHAVTIEVPQIQVAPGSLHESLPLGARLTRPLTISNAGPARLLFDLAAASHPSLAAGGPDSFGYTVKDSDEPGGPTYQWIEIAPPAGGDGIALDLPAVWQGGYSWPIPLPFPFEFYGAEYTQLGVNSYGTLDFTDRFVDSANLPLPSPRDFGVETFIAPFWDFLVVDPGAVYYQELDSMFIVEYYQVSRYGGSGHGTWQIILFDNGNMLFQYQDLDFDYYWGNYGRSATVGIQGDAITGLQYSCDTPALSDGLAICFAYPGQLPDCSLYTDVPWLAQNPSAGAVQAGDMQSVGIVFDAGAPGVAQGQECTATVVVATNDPDRRLAMLPVTLTVLPPVYGLTLVPSADARSGEIGATVVYTLHVTNVGSTFDTFDVSAGAHVWPTVAPAAIGPLAAGERAAVAVVVSIPPATPVGMTDTATITVTSQADHALSATASLTTRARPRPLFLPLVVRSPTH